MGINSWAHNFEYQTNVCGLVLVLILWLFFGRRFPASLRNGLSKLGIPTVVLDAIFNWANGSQDYPKIPEAKGAISAIRSEAFFIPLYELYLTYGGIFRLNFGPKVLSCDRRCVIFVPTFQPHTRHSLQH